MPTNVKRLQLLLVPKRTEGADRINTGHDHEQATAAEAINPSVSTLDRVVNDGSTCLDRLAVLANDTVRLATQSGRRSDARAAVLLNQAAHLAHLALEELSESGVAL